MPRYFVRVVKREVVVLFADMEVDADTADEARMKVQRIDRDDKIDDGLWQEEDSWYVNEPAEIKEVSVVNKH